MDVTGSTEVFGIIGDPIAHTWSPLMHNRALASMGIAGVYVPFRVTPGDLPDAVKGIRALGIMGMNVTVPHKTKVIPWLDVLTPAARDIGAVNTIINRGGVLTGDNTDVHGFEMTLRAGAGLVAVPPRVAVIGAGGAARSVVYACATMGGAEEIIILNRTFSRAEELAREMSALTGVPCRAEQAGNAQFDRELLTCGLIVNTTSVGMRPDEGNSPVPDPAVFHPGQVVCDIVYNPPETRLLREASARGAKTIGGITMLAWQGARSLSLWTGKDAPVEVMLAALQEQMIVTRTELPHPLGPPLQRG